MKKTLRTGIFLGSFVLLGAAANAQCLSAANGPWINFNSNFGGAPCDDGTGCPLNEINTFEIWASEAYALDNVVAGGTYTFSACNGADGDGTGGNAWPLTFTVISPSENVDAFGLDSGSNCALTWTASESGIYLILVNEEGACGDTTNANMSVNNGFPAVTCASSAETMCGSIGISENASINGLKTYPNPTNGQFTIEVADLVSGNTLVEVLDISGRVISSRNVSHGNQLLHVVDLAGEPAGSYMVRLTMANEVMTTHVMLNK